VRFIRSARTQRNVSNNELAKLYTRQLSMRIRRRLAAPGRVVLPYIEHLSAYSTTSITVALYADRVPSVLRGGGSISDRIKKGILSGSVAEWLACWTQAQKARVQIAAATLSGNSLRQTVHTHRASVHQAAQLVAALLRVAGVTAGLAESNGSLPPGL